MKAALNIITSSLCLILIALSLRACSAPPPRRPDTEPECAEDEEDPRAEVLAELHALRDEMQLNHAEVVFLTMDLDDPSLNHMDPVIIPHLIKPLAPDTRTPSFCLDWEIGQKWLNPLEHEPSELISGSGRPLNFYLTDNLIMDK